MTSLHALFQFSNQILGFITGEFCEFFFFFILMLFIFFRYSWCTGFCQFSTVQHGDPVTHTYVRFFLTYHAPA